MKSEKKIVLVTGMPGSGKSLVSNYLVGKGYTLLSMGDIIREIAVERRVPKTSKNLLAIAMEVRRIYGSDGVAKLLLKKINKKSDLKRIVIDGLRSISEAKTLMSMNGCIKIVSVHASPETRFKRLLKRKRPGDPKNWEDFVYRDKKELSLGLGDIIAVSDMIIVNENVSEEELNKKLLEMMRRIEKCSGESELKYL